MERVERPVPGVGRTPLLRVRFEEMPGLREAAHRVLRDEPLEEEELGLEVFQVAITVRVLGENGRRKEGGGGKYDKDAPQP